MAALDPNQFPIEFRKNEFPLDILADHTYYRLCDGCLFWTAIKDVKAWVKDHPHDAERLPQLVLINYQAYKTEPLDEQVENLDTRSYEITLEGQAIFKRIGQNLDVKLPEREYCVIS